ncbi:hypothetical protein B0O80DRAFT_498867 [Mortierella sp. GBAus27b]|nr:hypothetical protein B0O80DRAFT_498867 [Mortierella sp. GBAus27b]
MKFTTFSVLSALLAVAAVVQAAPVATHTSAHSPTPSSTPGANAPKKIPFTAVNPSNSTDVVKGEAQAQPKGAKTPNATPDTLRCWNARFNGRSFSITCSGSRWYFWTDCTNGYLYIGGPLHGTFIATITCPAGSIASKGGAYGY